MSGPLIVLLRLHEHDIFGSINQELISALEEKAQVRNAKTASEARRLLTSSTRPQAVFVADAAIILPKYRDIHLLLVQYAKDGGTVVYGGTFSSFVTPPDLDTMFKNMWGLTWRASDYTREDFTVNTHARTLHTSSLVKRYSMKALFVSGVAFDAAAYLETYALKKMTKGRGRVIPATTQHKTPAAFTKVGKGRVGYVGDVNAEAGTTTLVLAMCFHPGSHPLIAPGTGEPSTSTSAGTNIHHITSNNSGQSSPSHAHQKRVLIVSLEREDCIDDLYSPLFQALRKNAHVREVHASVSVIQALSSTSRPDAVLVSDAGITRSEHADVLNRLVDYAHSGGTVVLAMQFSNHFQLNEARSFFSKWSVPWDVGSYHRTTFALNPAGVPHLLSKHALFPSYSMKALHIKNAPRESAVYLPTPESHVESHVFAPTPITGVKALESPAVFTRIGEGFLGYVGDVNGEQGSIRVIIEMCGVQIKPGDMGPRTFTTGVTLHPDGTRDATKDTEQEIPLANPPRVPRLREVEVTARAARLARIRDDKIKRADILKNEGNEFFRAEKWLEAAEKYRAAAFIAGPRPVYLSNLAAALLKVRLWADAESAASRALLHEPKHLKSLYRRALALKEQERFIAAEADLDRLLVYDPMNASARSERLSIREEKAHKRSRDWPGDKEEAQRREKQADISLDIEDESDSQELSHAGNGIPCKFYNHDGCRHGNACRFKHAPDTKSVRDELGRNVCIYWLVGECRFADRCVYAHDGTYLPERGWWTDTTRLARLRKEFKDAVNNAPRPLGEGHSESILAEALRPTPWRNDLWAEAAYGAEVALMKEEEEDEAEELRRWEEGSDSDGYEDEWEERADHYGHLTGDFDDMLMYGIKPWDIDAYDELTSVRSALGKL